VLLVSGFREKFVALRFSTFATQSTQSGLSEKAVDLALDPEQTSVGLPSISIAVI